MDKRKIVFLCWGVLDVILQSRGKNLFILPRTQAVVCHLRLQSEISVLSEVGLKLYL